MKVKLKDIAKFSKGVQINGDDLIEGGKYIYLNGGINPSGRWNVANVEKDTVTISEGGNSSGYINYIMEPFWCGAHCYYLYDVPKNTKYLYYALKSQQERLFAIRSGACMPNIKKADLGNFEFEFDFDEKRQDDIVACLDKAKRIIEVRQHELQLLDDLIKARFVEMFGDDIPSVKLGEICKMINGDRGKNYPSGNDFVAEGVPFVNAGHLQNRQVDFSGMNYITEEKFDLLSQGKMQEDDILYCLRGSLGKHGLVTFERGAVASSLVILRCDKSKVLPKYLLYAIETPDIERQLKAANNGSSQPNLSAASVKAYDIKLPSLDEQRKFVAFVAQVDKSKFVVQQALDQAQLLFDSFMQKYFG